MSEISNLFSKTMKYFGASYNVTKTLTNKQSLPGGLLSVCYKDEEERNS